jgi:hypothetical protein
MEIEASSELRLIIGFSTEKNLSNSTLDWIFSQSSDQLLEEFEWNFEPEIARKAFEMKNLTLLAIANREKTIIEVKIRSSIEIEKMSLEVQPKFFHFLPTFEKKNISTLTAKGSRVLLSGEKD